MITRLTATIVHFQKYLTFLFIVKQ